MRCPTSDRRAHRTAVLAAALVAVAGCASVPLPRPLSTHEAALVAAAPQGHLRAGIAGCAPSGPHAGPPCELLTLRVTEVLKATGAFREVGRATGTQDVSVLAHQVETPRDEASPARSVGLLLLSVIVPLWSSETFGYRLTVEDRSHRRVEVDTTREGTRVIWSLAPLLNLSPDRGFVPSRDREAEHVELQLLPLLTDGVAAGDRAAEGKRDGADEAHPPSP